MIIVGVAASAAVTVVWAWAQASQYPYYPATPSYGPGMMGPGGVTGSGTMGPGTMGPGGMMGGGMMGPGGMMGSGGMMGGGMMGPAAGPRAGDETGTPRSNPSSPPGYRSGMMGPGGMMGGMSGMPMMGGMMGYYSGVLPPLSHADAKATAERYLESLRNPDLSIDEFEEYSHNFYVSIVEKSTGRGVSEVIIDRFDGAVQLEPQSMMWNTEYGMMGGYPGSSAPRGEMTVTSDQAKNIAQDFLDLVYPGTATGDIVAYYGYYTVMTTLNGKHYGMLSVNGFSGDVWYHTWHGMFISEVE